MSETQAAATVAEAPFKLNLKHYVLVPQKFSFRRMNLATNEIL